MRCVPRRFQFLSPAVTRGHIGELTFCEPLAEARDPRDLGGSLRLAGRWMVPSPAPGRGETGRTLMIRELG